MKINSKLGSVGHNLVQDATTSIKFSHVGVLKDTMIVGADVTHPGQGDRGIPSMAAVVATNDDSSSHYLGSARLQKSKDEVSFAFHQVTKIRALISRQYIWDLEE